MGSSGKGQVKGYKYYLGMHFIFCHGPIDKFTKIEFDSKVAWTGNATGGTISLSAETLFGGEDREGGISGDVDIDMGSDTQLPNSYLVSKLGSFVPGFRGVVGAIFKRFYFGMTPYLKPPSFWGQRILVRQNGIPQWYIAKAPIGSDLNPSHIIRECLTDPDWGMGYSETEMDDVAFMAAADQLFIEGMGISLLWDKSVTLEDFIKEILKHIDGSLYVDRSTGKFVLKLARGGYTIDSLLVLDENSIDKITDFKRNTVGELINSVTVIYTDATTGEPNSVTVQDIALASQQQAVVGTTKQFPGFTNGTIATKVAERSLKALSVSIASGTIYTNRVASSLNIGDVFVLNWPRYGIAQLVMRVGNIELGALDNNVVKLTVVEDVFALNSAIYMPPPPSGWTSPITAPAPCPYHYMMEAPYWEVCQRMGESYAASVDANSGFALIAAVRPSGDSLNAKLFTNPSNTTYSEVGTMEFCPTAVLTANMDYVQTVVPITQGVDLDLVTVGTYAVLGTELISIVAISDTSMTIGRGVLDTVPAKHTLGDRIFFADVYFGNDKIEYTLGETARVKVLPTTNKGTLLESSATAQTFVIQKRNIRPYVPQNFKLNGAAYPTSVLSTADIVVTWSHRDRLQQTATLIDTTSGDIGPEAGTTYTCRVLLLAGTVIATHSALSVTITTFTLAELGANYGQLRIQLWATRGGVDSFQIHDFQFTR